MRDLPTVIEKIKEVVPAEEEILLLELESVRQSALFAAPERMRRWWFVCQEILTEHVPGGPGPVPDWQRKVINLWTDRGGN